MEDGNKKKKKKKKRDRALRYLREKALLLKAEIEPVSPNISFQ